MDAPKPEDTAAAAPGEAKADTGEQLAGGTYEIIRNRLATHGQDLRGRVDKLNAARKEVFGAIETSLLTTARIATDNNCMPRDMVPLGSRFLFGYNVHLGLRTQMEIPDVFAIYEYADHHFTPVDLTLLGDPRFESDFRELFKYYKDTVFIKFSVIGPHLYMVFRIGKVATDIKVFKWIMREDGTIIYVDNRSGHEVRFPPQHEFEWIRTHLDMKRSGRHPHISIEDRIFVETVGGDLTIKVEDSTDVGTGVYMEPVSHKDQTLDDAEIFYATVGNLILLKIRPYQEDQYRYIVYSEKVEKARRISQIEHSCVMLPEGYGIIFSNGFYLQTGDYKEFDSGQEAMLFEKRIAAPNGEDYLYVFYNRETGDYALLSYNMIDQAVESPIICQGYCLFPNGDLLYFKQEKEPRKSHVIQIWKTPFVGEDHHAASKPDSHLFKIGNRDIVRCMASCGHILGLIGRGDSYANLYIDIVRQTTEVLDANYWLDHAETFRLDEPLKEIQKAAEGAIEEFEKVVRMRKATRDRIVAVARETDEILTAVKSSRFESIDEFVKILADLRAVRGSIISLRDLRYADLDRVAALEGDVVKETDLLSERCVEFLLGENALEPYRKQVEEMKASIGGLEKVSEAKKVEEAIAACGGELELLIDIVSNLKIDDATQRTRIIDSISDIYSTLNQIRAALKRRMGELSSAEGVAEFGSQMKLIAQAVLNYLEVCDTPEKCDEYLSKLMIQLEELEGRFAELEEFVDRIAEKREEIYTAFESRKVALVEKRNRRADGLVRSAERVLKGIRTRVEGFDTVEEINGYFASDLMIDKVRDIVETLIELEDTVRADDIRSRLKTIQEDTVRQLTDKKELYSGDGNIIRFGDHQFSVNTQPLDLTTVRRDSELLLHLTGTQFFEEITNPELLSTRGVWDQEVVSENRSVYRGEYLAYVLLKEFTAPGADPSWKTAAGWSDEERQSYVRTFMGSRYVEAYSKGVHDHDASLILGVLLELHGGIGLLRYSTRARALAAAYWHRNGEGERLTRARVQGFGEVVDVFKAETLQAHYVDDLRGRIEAFAESDRLFDKARAPEAAEYLFHVLRGDGLHPVSQEASKLHQGFTEYLRHHGAEVRFRKSLEKLKEDPAATFGLVCDWVDAFIRTNGAQEDAEYRNEAAVLLVAGKLDPARVAKASVRKDLSGLSGNHAALEGGTYRLHYNEFVEKLTRFVDETVPAFEHCHTLKKQVVDQARTEMRLHEFRPQVLTSFVRNRLIDSVYLPLVGANLAKQIGTAGDDKRTDRMGMLLLISPPGYGKTTLMEYLANRLGIIFMKINGPAIGHQVTSIDPGEAPNATAREELAKLNLALEMGDNVMIYLDDIQHLNPEFLQKFISLCDAQRKIEGVYKGRARTYDLRGRKVAVVMAGNPYTESGEAFRVPDMLANRADTYNLGNIIGDNDDAFKLSYLENALTSNPSLNRLISKNRKDVHGIIRIAETGSREGVDLAGNYTADELDEAVNVMKKLLRVRDIVLTVNQEYIRSAAQADAYRTEPSFKLQGSYRNMGRIAEKVLPVMNDAELETLVASDYENEAQTLTTGAEANLLKFKHLAGTASPEEKARWEEIKKTFQKRQQMMGVEGSDRMGQVIGQLSTFSEGLESIRAAVTHGVQVLGTRREKESEEQVEAAEFKLAEESLTRLEALVGSLASELRPRETSKKKDSVVETRLSDDTLESMAGMIARLPRGAAPSGTSPAGKAGPPPELPPIQIVSKLPRGLLQVIQEQLKLFKNWLDPLLSETNKQSTQLKGLRQSLDSMVASFKVAMAQLDATRVESPTQVVEGGTRRKQRRSK